MPTYGSMWPGYAKQWDSMAIRSSKLNEFKSIAQRLVAAKDRYVSVEKKTGVPWYMIACIHERESSQDWKASLAQGDPWNRVSTHVPRGRGPFKSWEEAAIDALQLDGLTKVKDWRLEKVIYYWELFNGWGYYNHSVPSAYVWAGSTVYSSGKYVADGVWSSTAVDTQLGCAPLLKAMMDLDKSIKPIRESKDDKPSITNSVIVGAGTAAGGTAAAAHTWNLWDHPYILVGGALAAAVVIGLIVHWLRKGKQNVVVNNGLVVDKGQVEQVQ